MQRFCVAGTPLGNALKEKLYDEFLPAKGIPRESVEPAEPHVSHPLYGPIWQTLWRLGKMPWEAFEIVLAGRDSLCGPWQDGVLKPMLEQFYPNEEVIVTHTDGSFDIPVTIGDQQLFFDAKKCEGFKLVWVTGAVNGTASWVLSFGFATSLTPNQVEAAERGEGEGDRLHSLINVLPTNFGEFDYIALQLYMKGSGRTRGEYYEKARDATVNPLCQLKVALPAALLETLVDNTVRIVDPAGRFTGIEISVPKSRSASRPTVPHQLLEADFVVRGAVARLVANSRSAQGGARGRVLGAFNFA